MGGELGFRAYRVRTYAGHINGPSAAKGAMYDSKRESTTRNGARTGAGKFHPLPVIQISQIRIEFLL